jgi:hypothetical protein
MKKVFLGGTCNNSSWREKIIPLLKIDYFNPVVKDWTKKCQEIELKERKICDFCLYTITPKMSGVYSIAEVVDDSNKKPEQTVLVLLRKDENLIFTEAEWKSLTAVANLVAENNAWVFYSLEQAADYLNS